MASKNDIRFAYTGLVGDGFYFIGRADEGVTGYTPLPNCPTFPTYDEAQEWAKSENEELGLSPLEVSKIVLSTLGMGKR